MSIQNPVGRYGLNKPSSDVGVIQSLINSNLDANAAFKASGIGKLTVDRSCGPRTIAAIEAFQKTVLKWSGPSVDGTVNPGRATWKALNGNVPDSSSIKPQPTGPLTVSGFSVFKQGNYKDKLGSQAEKSIAGYGCALCTLAMAATLIGSRTKHWPENLAPKDLTPPIANRILASAGVFSGYSLVMDKAANALGMDYDGVGSAANQLKPEYIDAIDWHLSTKNPIACHVDFKASKKEGVASSEGDHWILLIGRSGDGTYSAIDPAYGTVMKLASNRNQTVNNARYAETAEDRKGILFGYKGSGGAADQEKYIVVRFALLAPA
jgi:hypothetical protein